MKRQKGFIIIGNLVFALVAGFFGAAVVSHAGFCAGAQGTAQACPK